MGRNSYPNARTEPAKQGVRDVLPGPMKSGPPRPVTFESQNLTACCGLFPGATMPEKLGFRPTCI